jgi:hypothetical protein
MNLMNQNKIPDFLAALRLREEQTCANYLDARKAMLTTGARAASLSQLVAEQPKRRDYRDAWNKALSTHEAAIQRTRLAWVSWQRVQRQYDAAWTATEGRNPRILASSEAA